MTNWLQRWRAHRESRVLARRAIPDDLWQLTLARLPFLARRSREDVIELRRLASLLLDRKEFHGTDGLVVDDAMAVCIAAQAVLPVLRFGLGPYDGFVGIVVHPDEVVARREVTDEHGIVHAYDEVLAGEAMDGGPVMLSWRDVAEAGESADWGYNVVIHEFAHVLDMGDGMADGVPPLPTAAARGRKNAAGCRTHGRPWPAVSAAWRWPRAAAAPRCPAPSARAAPAARARRHPGPRRRCAAR